MSDAIRALLRSRFVKFGMVGAAGFVVDEAVLSLLHFVFHVDPYTARIVSIFCAATFTWWGNRTLTFAEHAASGGLRPLAREWAKFMLANAVGAVANYASYSALVRFAPLPLANPLLATAIGVGVGMVFNFTLSKRFVFRADTPAP